MKYMTAEPFRIKVVEPLRKTTKEERQQWLEEASYNAFKLKADTVYVDCLTDSGTSAMSTNQWSALMVGDESYAGCKSFYKLEESVRDVFGMPMVQPTHQAGPPTTSWLNSTVNLESMPSAICTSIPSEETPRCWVPFR